MVYINSLSICVCLYFRIWIEFFYVILNHMYHNFIDQIKKNVNK